MSRYLDPELYIEHPTRVHSGFISPYFKTFITKSRIIVGRPFPDCARSFPDSAHFSLRPQQHLHFTLYFIIRI